ncbi:uncharacterized protein [Amphiura filiformis]|uniref:uncharacterized protein n=1 Tax=Amphiura filiformis TaxID=82378 RepID=UPI003B2184C6
MGITRLDKIRNTVIRESLGLKETIIDRVTTKRPKYFGHVNRIQPSRYPNILLTSNIHGDRPRGRPAKKWTDCVKADCATRNLSSLAEATSLSRDRRIWQAILKQNLQKPSHIPKMVWTV